MPPKLLLADDSVTIQRVIELTFAEEDVQVLTAGDGEQAIQRVREDRPDIVLADIGMPKRSGYDVAAFIKADPELSHIPVLLLTGAFEPVDEGRAQAVGCDGVLTKPFEPQHVIARVRELLKGDKSRSTTHTAPEVPRTLDRLAPPRPLEMPPRYASASDTIPTEDRPAGDFDFGGAQDAPSAEAGSTLDDYFDRLDAAFANISTQGATPAATEPEPVHEPELVPRHEGPVMAKELDWFDSPSQTPNVPPSNIPATFASPSSSFEWPVPGVVEGLTAGIRHPEPPPPEPPDGTPTLSADPSPTAAAVRVSAPAMPSDTEISSTSAARAPAVPPNAIADAFSALLAVEQGEPGATPLRLGPAAGGPQLTEELVEEITRRVIERLAPNAVRSMVSQVVTEVAERLVREEIQRLRSRQ